MQTFNCWTDDPEEADEIKAYGFEDAAAEYADFCWSNRDGWEWLTTGTEVNVSNGDETQTFSITVEHIPMFSASKKEAA